MDSENGNTPSEQPASHSRARAARSPIITRSVTRKSVQNRQAPAPGTGTAPSLAHGSATGPAAAAASVPKNPQPTGPNVTGPQQPISRAEQELMAMTRQAVRRQVRSEYRDELLLGQVILLESVIRTRIVQDEIIRFVEENFES